MDWLTLKGGFNVVRGYNNSTDRSLDNHNIPHVPADNMRFGAEVHRKHLGDFLNPYFGFDERLTQSQRREAPGDTPTPGYALLDLHTGSEFLVMNNRMTVDAGVENLLDKTYIDYNSILKPFNIPNPGRNVFVKVSVPFGS